MILTAPNRFERIKDKRPLLKKLKRHYYRIFYYITSLYASFFRIEQRFFCSILAPVRQRVFFYSSSLSAKE